MGTRMTSIPTPAPACQNCEDAYPGFCRRCAYLMNNMRRWRRVAAQLHRENCKHPTRQVPTSCSTLIESMYNQIDDTEMGLL
jgi:hypothetical protein